MTAIVLFLACAFVAIGSVRLFVLFLDYHDTRVLASFRAEQLIAWAKLEAEVIAAERAISADKADRGFDFDFDSDEWHVAEVRRA